MKFNIIKSNERYVILSLQLIEDYPTIQKVENTQDI